MKGTEETCLFVGLGYFPGPIDILFHSHSLPEHLCSLASLCLCFLFLKQLFLQMHSLTQPRPHSTMPNPMPVGINPHPQCIPMALTSCLSCYTPGSMLLKIIPGERELGLRSYLGRDPRKHFEGVG